MTSLSARALGTLIQNWRTSGPGPAYAALADRIRLLVLDGRLALGTRLPAERELAAHLGLSRTTVSAAYADLRDSGYLDSIRGSGSVVRLAVARSRRRSRPDRDARLPRLQQGDPAGGAGGRRRRRARGRAAAALPRRVRLRSRSGCACCARRSPTGTRRAGCPTDADEIMITIGAQHAIGLLARTLLVARRPRARRGAELPARLRGAARERGAARAGAGDDRRGLGRARARAGVPAHQPDPRLPDARLPQPDRPLDVAGAARAHRRPRRAAGHDAGRRRDDGRARPRRPGCPRAVRRRSAARSRSGRSARPSGAGCGSAGSAPTASSSSAPAACASPSTSAPRSSSS